MRFITTLAAFAVMTFSCAPAFAADAGKAATALTNAAAPIVVTPAPDLPVGDFVSQVLQAIKDFGGLPWVARIALIVTLLISSMKVSWFRSIIWEKIGAMKPWVAPALGLILGVLTLAQSHQLTLAGILAWVSAGAGAIILHELLDSLKSIPGLGMMWTELIGVIMSFLGGKKTE